MRSCVAATATSPGTSPRAMAAVSSRSSAAAASARCASAERAGALDTTSAATVATARAERRGIPLTLLRTTEQSAEDRLGEDVALHRLEHVRTRFERVARRLDADRRVERVDLEHVVMLRSVRAGARSPVHQPGRADL